MARGRAARPGCCAAASPPPLPRTNGMRGKGGGSSAASVGPNATSARARTRASRNVGWNIGAAESPLGPAGSCRAGGGTALRVAGRWRGRHATRVDGDRRSFQGAAWPAAHAPPTDAWRPTRPGSAAEGELDVRPPPAHQRRFFACGTSTAGELEGRRLPSRQRQRPRHSMRPGQPASAGEPQRPTAVQRQYAESRTAAFTSVGGTTCTPRARSSCHPHPRSHV